MQITISYKSMLLRFAGCQPEYIRGTCHGRCCNTSACSQGFAVVIHSTERWRIENLGGTVRDGFLVRDDGKKGCPFKDAEGFCSLHFTPHKPIGCIASPFVLNKNDKLLVRNRYKLMKCYRAGLQLPAYEAFTSSLRKLFGHDQWGCLCGIMQARGGKDFTIAMPDDIYQMLKDNEEVRHHVG